jgi:lysyl-tRNA synthetase class 2
VARIDVIKEQRREKLRKMRGQGIDPYPHRYHRSHTNKEAILLFKRGDDSPVSLAGRIVACRAMGKATFIDLRDSSGKIQAYFAATSSGISMSSSSSATLETS